MMRKSLIGADPSTQHSATEAEDSWLDLGQLATVEITSEDPLFPIENALKPAHTSGWQASCKGPQLIRLNFNRPVPIRRILIHFVESAAERSQEFSIHVSDNGGQMREVLRQQFTFDPRAATEETEDFTVNLPAVASLELRIDPDRAHNPAHSRHFAVLQRLRIA